MVSPLDREVFPVDLRLQRTVHGLQEVVTVSLHVEANEVGAQQSVQQFSLPGTNVEGLGIGPWDMPEDGHAGVGTRSA